MRLLTTTLLAIAATTGVTHAQCEGFFDDFETYAVGQSINTVAGWTGNNNATVQFGTGSNFSQVLRVDPGGGFSSTAARSVPANVASLFSLTCDVKAMGLGELRLICGSSAIGGLRFDSAAGTVASFTNPGQTLPLLSDFTAISITGEAGGQISISYGGQVLDTHAWPGSCAALTNIQWSAIGFGGTNSLTEVDTLCMGIPVLGSTYCMSNPNSTGVNTALGLTGSAMVSSNNITLTASSMPTNASCYFLTSQTQGFSANPGGSMGNLCVSGVIGRFLGPGQVGNSGATGTFAMSPDLTAFPQPNGPVAVLVGDTWNFQAWHRDSVNGNAVSNFSDAVTVTFL